MVSFLFHPFLFFYSSSFTLNPTLSGRVMGLVGGSVFSEILLPGLANLALTFFVIILILFFCLWVSYFFFILVA